MIHQGLFLWSLKLSRKKTKKNQSIEIKCLSQYNIDKKNLPIFYQAKYFLSEMDDVFHTIDIKDYDPEQGDEWRSKILNPKAADDPVDTSKIMTFLDAKIDAITKEFGKRFEKYAKKKNVQDVGKKREETIGEEHESLMDNTLTLDDNSHDVTEALKTLRELVDDQ